MRASVAACGASGSSPLTRGKLSLWADEMHRMLAHPRSRGEYALLMHYLMHYTGSSPAGEHG